ncbi:hypothetical protein BOTBODRAFT_172162 [Botryobasidium botryosum FD-172 SS1]|uniref:F-box domain-containing protein n=1 Tax=Botryobasidium botryosum (strain FD-172 SS1) TaxID=930990 RepID=A0A067MPQ6_BOTB1|nr:hypothetical protein BOTBODRAFT_172162 [Botryobasidium botryosum FD-172 SS1]
MQKSGNTFLKLFPSLRLAVLLELDIKDVFALQATSKEMQNEIVANRGLWYAHLKRLGDEYAPEIPPHVDVDALQGPGLKGVVTRALRAHANWGGESAPKAVRQTTVVLHNPDGAMGNLRHGNSGHIVHLVPGGEYLMVGWSKGFLQCYHVLSKECIWTFPDPASRTSIPDFSLKAFGVDLTVEEGETKLMVAITGQLQPKENSCVLELYKINVLTKESIMVLRRDIGITTEHRGVILRGEFLLVIGEQSIFVANWLTAQFVEITKVSLHADRIRVEGDYVVCVIGSYGRGKPFQLAVIPLKKLFATAPKGVEVTPGWIKVPFAEASLPPIDIECPAEQKMQGAHLLSVKPTWRRESDISIYLVAEVRKDFGTICRYAYKYVLKFDRSDDSHYVPSLVFEAISKPAHEYHWEMIHYVRALPQTGRGFFFFYVPNTGGFIFEPFSLHEMLNNEEGKELSKDALSLNAGPDAIHMEHYSGAIAFATPDSAKVIINHYD